MGADLQPGVRAAVELDGFHGASLPPAPRDPHGGCGATRDPQQRVTVGAPDVAARAQAHAVVALDAVDPPRELAERARALVPGAPALLEVADRDRVDERA